jgi:tetratricopeptide (TPR) repeat protein
VKKIRLALLFAVLALSWIIYIRAANTSDSATAGYRELILLAAETDAQTGATPYREKRLRESGTGSARDYYERGRIYLVRKNYDAALSRFQKAIELDPDFAEAHYVIGRLYLKLDKPEKALWEFKKAIALEPDNVRLLAASYFSRGELLHNAKRDREAMADLDKAIELLPDAGLFYLVRSDVFENAGNYELALNDLEKAVQLNPEYGPKLQERIRLLREKLSEESDAP